MPVVVKGSRQEIVAASLCHGRLWQNIEIHHLCQNMHLGRTQESDVFAAWLLRVGAGTDVDEEGKLSFPESMLCRNDMQSLINSTYPDLHLESHSDQYYLECTILSCKNNDVDNLNSEILVKLPEEEHVLMSADSVNAEEYAHNFQPYPVEFLNFITASGPPLSKLALKSGCPLMLLCNLDPSKGLCNGTHLILVNIQPHVLECRIISRDEKFAGKLAFIPRMTLVK